MMLCSAGMITLFTSLLPSYYSPQTLFAIVPQVVAQFELPYAVLHLNDLRKMSLPYLSNIKS